MSKSLLSESEIKDFMKYANLGKEAASNFIERLNENTLDLAEQDEPAEDAEAEEAAPEEAAAEEPPGAGGEDEAMESAVEQVVGAIVKALGEVPGAPEISMEGGDAMDAPEADMAEVPGAEDMEAGDADAMAAAEEPAEEESPEMAMERLMEAIEEAEMYLEDAMGMDEDEMEEGMYEGEMEEDMYEGEMEEDLYEEDMSEMAKDDYAAFGDAEAPAMDEVVNEVTRRVAARILKSRKSGNKRR